MRHIDVGDLAHSLASRCQNLEEIQAALADMASTDWNTLLGKIEYERHQWECQLCREFKDKRTFTYVINPSPTGYKSKSDILNVCPECLLTAQYQVPCIACDKVYRSVAEVKPDHICFHCHDSIHQSVRNTNSRARVLNLPATLTPKDWAQALRYFNHKCAYCEGTCECVEHYHPLSLEGGSTRENCLPACWRCNTKKKDRHPDTFHTLFSAENLERIRAWVSSHAA